MSDPHEALIAAEARAGAKKLAETLFSRDSTAFKRVVMIEWPRPGLWTIGFQTGTPAHEVRQAVSVEMVSVYVPTTPNPTSGFFLMMPTAELRPLNMTVDEALKYIISMGVVSPPPAAKVPGEADPNRQG